MSTDTTEETRRWVWPGILEEVGGRWRLVGAACRGCGRHVFPQAPICPDCLGTEFERVHLSPEGTVYSVTTVATAPPGFTAPYGLGWVDFPEGVRVFGQVAEPERVRVGDRVEVTVGTVRTDPDGTPVFGHVFRKVEG